jgi:6-phosphogluconolactonase
MRDDIEVFSSAAALADAAARRFVAAAGAAIVERGEFIVALAGGSTPRNTYERLAEQYALNVDWPRVHVLWGDERCVPPFDMASNYGMARAALLDHVRVRSEHVHRIHGEDDPGAEAIAYEKVLRDVLKTPVGAPRRESGARIDLVILGLGADGHTASLFPGAPVAGEGTHGTEASGGDARWVEAVFVKAGSMWRVTLTPVVINAAAEVVFIVSGGAKAAMVRRVLEGPRVPHVLPAQLIARGGGHVRWLLDAAAAAELP